MKVRVINREAIFVENHRRRFNAEFDLVDPKNFNKKTMVEVLESEESGESSQAPATGHSKRKPKPDTTPTGAADVI